MIIIIQEVAGSPRWGHGITALEARGTGEGEVGRRWHTCGALQRPHPQGVGHLGVAGCQGGCPEEVTYK